MPDTGSAPVIDAEAVSKLIGRASPGCAIAVSFGERRFEFAAGTYSDEDRRPVGVRTAYDIASITKLFTAALILRLHDSGAVDIEGRVRRYLPQFEESALTVTDLLTHHAGLESEPLSRLAARYPSADEMARRIRIRPEASPHFFYQNATFLYLGLIAEKIYGKPLSECMRDLIGELDLRDTRLGSDAGLDAPPTEIRDGVVWANRTHDESSYICGGLTGYAGIFSSARDLDKFARAWLEYRIASFATTKKAFSAHGRYPREEQGLGWFNTLPHFPVFPDWIFCHSGYTGPLVAVNPAKSRVYAVTMNRTYYGRQNQLYRELWARLLEGELREAMTMESFIARLKLNIDRYSEGGAAHGR
ncbi:MAG: beta-lactamase family protein [Synergistaceae bacterium]|jgi:CubicO group peptidase (beta-lactamase class C family)|nr:beta-lactamase family protein [Synergistaceae bacterium]